MAKNNIILLLVHLLILSGCVSTIQTIEEAEPVSKVKRSMSWEEVLSILGRPDYATSFGDETIFFYCTDLTSDTSEKPCKPIFFLKDKVALVGEKPSGKWSLELVQWKVAEDRKKKTVKTVEIAKAAKPKQPGGITEETLIAQKTYAPKEGDTVYVTFYTNIVRYIPLRSEPSDVSKILRTLCIGSELGVLAVEDPWLYVKGVNEALSGWVLERWVTTDRTVKIDTEKRRKALKPEIARLEAIVKPIPRVKWRQNLRLYEKLLGLDPCNGYYKRKVDYYENYGRKRGKRQ